MFCVSYIAVIVCDREAQRSEPPPGSELIRLGGSANGCAHMTHANELLFGQFRAAADTLRRPSLGRRSAIRLHREIEALIMIAAAIGGFN